MKHANLVGQNGSLTVSADALAMRNACDPTPPLHAKATGRESQARHRGGTMKVGWSTRGDLLRRTRTALLCEVTASNTGLSDSRPGAFGLLAISTVIGVLIAGPVQSQVQLPGTLGPLANLSDHGPSPQALRPFVKDYSALLRLGKALFWSEAAGFDGQSCASCHFHAGADNRSTNQISPGLLAGDTSFSPHGLNYTLTAGDFPIKSNNVVSSQGVPLVSILGDGLGLVDDVFIVDGLKTLRVEPRNTPTTINAGFSDRNFWDGRADSVFNGTTPGGWRVCQSGGGDSYIYKVERGLVRALSFCGGEIPVLSNSGPKRGQYNMSLHSQAVGPPLSTFEMAEAGLTFKQISERMIYKQRQNGKKTLRKTNALEGQFVDRNDSVLGALSRWPKDGLSKSFRELTLTAFVNAWVNPGKRVQIDGEQYTLIEANWPLIWGLAIGEYERTLKSAGSKFERYARGDSTALTDQEKLGLAVFSDKGKCINCHDGPTFSKATADHIRKNDPQQFIERMVMGDNGEAVYDNGFYNIGVRPTAEDLGVGAYDGTIPLSRTRQSQESCGDNATVDGPDVPGFCFEPVANEPGVDGPNFILPKERVAVRGAFKTSSLLNVALTAPYFHNGGMATLKQVVEFYDRGGDFANKEDLDPDIQLLGLTDEEEDALVAFMETLTDPRVARDAAPFDHPSLCIPVYHGDPVTGEKGIQDQNGDWIADVVKTCIPATGRGGMPGSSIANPSTPNFPAYAPPTP